MSDGRREAGLRFHAAIEALLNTYDDAGLLMEWVLVTACHSIDGDGDSLTACDHWVSDELPLYRALGLVEFQAEALRNEIRGARREEP